MASKPIVLTNFSGGWATDKKVGIDHSFAYSQSIDFRSSPSQFRVLPAPTREDKGVVTDLVQNAVMEDTGIIYGLGSGGSIYKRSTAGAWTKFTNFPIGYFGLLYRSDQDSIYVAGSTTVSLINPVTKGTATPQPNFYNISQSTYNNNANTPGLNVNSDQSNSSLTTLIGTSIMEGGTGLRYFQTDIEPINKIGVYITDRGTGNWTLTLHDGLNNSLGTVTVSNANLTSNAWNYFVFSSPVRAQVAPAAQTYHFHLTSTVADGYVSSSTANDLSSCDMQLWADRLVNTKNGMHPMAAFQQFICIGNEHYLSVYEPLGEASPSNSSWQRHKLTFPPGYEVCGLAVFNEYLAIACEKTTSGGLTPQDGIIFFWDGLSTSYNYFTLVPEGSPYAIHQHKNILFYEAGGAWYALTSVTAQPSKIRTLPFGENYTSNNNDSTKINPYAATVRNGVQLMAWPSVSTNTNIQFGVYSWGQVDKNMPNSFGYSYLISTGSQTYSGSNNLSIGMVQNFGDNLLISWRDDLNGGYGVDVINSSSKPASYATLETLIFDMGYPGKDKLTNYLEATYLALPVGTSVELKYSIDRGAWQTSPKYTVTDTWFDYAGYAREQMFGSDNASGRFKELQLGINIYCDSTATESPTITSLSTVIDTLATERLQ
jgi:hypothetical protein